VKSFLTSQKFISFSSIVFLGITTTVCGNWSPSENFTISPLKNNICIAYIIDYFIGRKLK